MLGRVRSAEHVRCLPGDVTSTSWWDGEPFDGAVSNMALMDIDDLDAVLRTVATVLETDGWLLLSLLHPCFPGLHHDASVQLSSLATGPRILLGGVVDHQE